MIAIPNMEIPKTCGECELRALDEWEDEYCVILVDDILVPYERMLDCPLIEIVQCKECKWLGVDDGMPFCYWWLREIEPDVFCSYGERRADEHNTERD